MPNRNWAALLTQGDDHDTRPFAVLAAANNANAQSKQTMVEKSLYERPGGVFAIAAVVDLPGSESPFRLDVHF